MCPVKFCLELEFPNVIEKYISWLLRRFKQELKRQTYLPTKEPAVVEGAPICGHPDCNSLPRALYQ